MRIKFSIGIILVLFFYSCNSKELIENSFTTESAQYKIIFPKNFDKSNDNYIEVIGYKSKFDSVIGKNRQPILYVFIEDTIIGDDTDLITLIENNKIDYGEYSVYDEKFKIPEKILMNKKGKYKLTVAVLDFVFNDTIKANPSNIHDEDKLEIDLLDSRSYHDITID